MNNLVFELKMHKRQSFANELVINEKDEIEDFIVCFCNRFEIELIVLEPLRNKGLAEGACDRGSFKIILKHISKPKIMHSLIKLYIESNLCYLKDIWEYMLVLGAGQPPPQQMQMGAAMPPQQGMPPQGNRMVSD